MRDAEFGILVGVALLLLMMVICLRPAAIPAGFGYRARHTSASDELHRGMVDNTLVVSGSYAFLKRGTVMRVFDISDPRHPKEQKPIQLDKEWGSACAN